MSNNGSKVKGLFTEIKTHWKTPAKGKYVPYREYLDILFGVGANYAGNFIAEQTGKNGAVYAKRHGFCLETQYYPDSVNKPQFPS